MNVQQFDRIARALGRATTRRRLLAALSMSPFVGLVSVRLADDAAARKRKARGKKEKKPRPNAFGCLDVGQSCGGNNRACCSGICQGRKPRKGKKDASRCEAHDAVTCQPGEREPFCGGAELVLCTTSTGFAGQCNTTTGNGGFCLASSACVSCATDAECQQVCGERAACLECTDCPGGTMCGSPDDLGCSAM